MIAAKFELASQHVGRNQAKFHFIMTDLIKTVIISVLT